MVQCRVWFLDGSSFLTDVDPQDPLKMLRAQLEKDLNLPRFYEVRLVQLAHEAQELSENDEGCIEVQALQVLSLRKVAEGLEAEVELAEEELHLHEEAVDTFKEALAPVEELQPGVPEEFRALAALTKLACRCSGKSSEHLGKLFSRVCGDVSPFMDVLTNHCRPSFTVCALAQMAERSERALLQHDQRIRAFLEKVLRHPDFSRCAPSDTSCSNDFVELLARFGDDGTVVRLENWIPELRRMSDSEGKSFAPQLDVGLERLRARLKMSH
eukprot:TRINITY_DN42062_c0_g1_i1.p1 TRINITY_DN42062_c0_g1~~TRINITY_DN42062_c0_g1_i1.p1  ORF type:complete len:270 (+),score=69.12 TRINITY_DN42062_c0_g1_i1:83-892(+)